MIGKIAMYLLTIVKIIVYLGKRQSIYEENYRIENSGYGS